MATKKWRGGAKAVSQITTISFSDYTSGQTYTVTCNGKSVSFEATASTAPNVVDGLVAAITADAALLPEFSDFSASNVSDDLRLTGNTAGIPFTVSASATTGTPTVTETQAADGPNFFDNAENWEGGAVPSSGDDLVFENSAVSLLYNLVDTTNYGDITIDSTYTGEIGLAATNAAGYPEYRARFLKLGDGTSASTIAIGQGGGDQSARINIDANDETVYLQVYGTGNGADDFAVTIKNMDSSSTIDYYNGNVKVDADTSGSAGTVRMNPQDTNANLLLTATVTAGAIDQTGGNLEVRGGATSLSIRGGTAEFTNAATCPTITIEEGATVFWSSSAGITTSVTVYPNGTLDFSRSLATKAVQAAEFHVNSTILDPGGIVTWTTAPDLNGIRSTQDFNFEFGAGKSILIS